MTELPNPWIDSTLAPEMAVETAAGPDADPPDPAADRFVFDECAFMADIVEFLADPSPEYLSAEDMIPMLAVLAGH